MNSDASNSRSIGIFDSGIGGLTVADAIARELPNERICYFGDTAHLPYGDKSADAISYYSLKIVKFLLDQQCKMVVIACNTAASTALSDILDFFGGRTLFVDVVDPLVNFAHQSGLQNLGVIATRATTNADVYRQKLHELNEGLQVSTLATPLLVPMIEEGFIENTISHVVLENYLRDESLATIDALLLACTHYPLIRKEIEDFYQGKVMVWDSAEVTAKEVRRQLSDHNLLSSQPPLPHRFFVSDLSETFRKATELFYSNSEIELRQLPIWT